MRRRDELPGIAVTIGLALVCLAAVAWMASRVLSVAY
jgi:hypothetical protein